MKTSRRGLFGLLAGAAVSPLLSKLPAALLPLPSMIHTTEVGFWPEFWPEMGSVTRSAFMPKVAVQIYKQHPMLSMMKRDIVHASLPPMPDRFVDSFNWGSYDKDSPDVSIGTPFAGRLYVYGEGSVDGEIPAEES